MERPRSPPPPCPEEHSQLGEQGVLGCRDLEPGQETASVVHLLHQGVGRVPILRAESSLAGPRSSSPLRSPGLPRLELTLTPCLTSGKSLPLLEMNCILSFGNFFDSLSSPQNPWF